MTPQGILLHVQSCEMLKKESHIRTLLLMLRSAEETRPWRSSSSSHPPSYSPFFSSLLSSSSTRQSLPSEFVIALQAAPAYLLKHTHSSSSLTRLGRRGRQGRNDAIKLALYLVPPDAGFASAARLQSLLIFSWCISSRGIYIQGPCCIAEATTKKK